MLRHKLFGHAGDKEFHYRGKEILRIEALSDAVFAFSVSLLVASLEVPQTFEELKMIARGAIPYFATVALIFLLWYQQYSFFRRYGLNDITTILLNLVYLAVILFYVYPLKFLFSLLISSWSGINLFEKAAEQGHSVLNPHELYQLIILFSAGYFFVWITLYFMHLHVLKLKQQYNFSRFELLFTKKETRGALWNALIGLAAIILATARLEWQAGICYLLIPFILVLNEMLFRRSLRPQIIRKKNGH
ncbi:MAG: TMEM175 family protein [Ferruginibacter sp.]